MNKKKIEPIDPRFNVNRKLMVAIDKINEIIEVLNEEMVWSLDFETGKTVGFESWLC